MSLAILHMANQILTLDIKDKDRWRRMFISNKHFGIIVTLAFLLGRYYQKNESKDSS